MASQYAFKGLSQEAVNASRQRHGSNTLTPPKPVPTWRLYLEKFKDPMVLILLVALTLSFGIAIYEFFHADIRTFTPFFEPTGILIAIFLSTGISFYFEQKAAKEFNLLNHVNDETLYKVIRDGELHQIPKHDLVVNDVVLLETGEEVPADGRLLEAVSLQVNESSLTGEPIANKYVEIPENHEETPYPADHLYRGTVITEGHGTMEVTAVGDATEAGKVFQGLSFQKEVQTPLQQQLGRLAKFISYVGYTVAALVILGRTFVFFHEGMQTLPWMDISSYFLTSFMLAVTILVVAVPEGLPMSVSLSLALSMRSMMKTNNLVRRMHACETMGATTVICTDKTGTLTCNQMRVHTLFDGLGARINPESRNFPLLAKSIAANTTAYLEQAENGTYSVVGNPTEGALLLWLQGHGQNYLELRNQQKQLAQLTFSTERKYMATLVTSGEGEERVLLIKGAPEVLLEMCQDAITADGKTTPLAELKDHLNEHLHHFQGQGMRTLALVVYMPKGEEQLFENGRLTVTGFTLVGLAAINDPVRADVPAAIAECQAAGVGVKIVTGDTLLTTQEIARQIGLWDNQCSEKNAMSGAELASLSDEEVLPRLSDLRIMYRARPLDKARLTGLLQSQGEVVAVTGDGTNDAPALRKAHVGLSMGDGTAVAKEASDITILDNSFVSIGQAILWGRSLYQNIQRFIIFQMTINLAACLVVLIGAFLGKESPLTVTQMLWINLVMDTFAALALASLPPDRQVMKRKPRNPKQFIITKPMLRIIVGTGLFFVVVLYGLLQLFMKTHMVADSGSTISNLLLQIRENTFVWNANNLPAGYASVTRYELSLFFSLFVFMQIWNLFNAKAFRSGKSAFYDLKRSKSFLLVFLFIFVCQWLLMAVGGQIFSLVPLHWGDQIWVILFTSLVVFIPELLRSFTHALRKPPAQ